MARVELFLSLFLTVSLVNSPLPAREKKPLPKLKADRSHVFCLVFTKDGKTLASGGYDGVAKLWDTEKWAEKTSAHPISIPVPMYCVAFTPDGRTLATGGGVTQLQLWDAQKGKLTAALKGHDGTVLPTAFSPDGKTLASGADDGIKLWDVAKGKETKTLKGHSHAVSCLAFDARGKTLVSGSYDKTVKLWDLNTGKVRTTLLSPAREKLQSGREW